MKLDKGAQLARASCLDNLYKPLKINRMNILASFNSNGITIASMECEYDRANLWPDPREVS